jgi:hypothetical protein
MEPRTLVEARRLRCMFLVRPATHISLFATDPDLFPRVVFIIPVLCFPAAKGADLNDLNMNYTSLIYGGVMLFALLWYAIDARKWFKGPRINVEHIIHGADVDERVGITGSEESVPEKSG